jgi:predicted alpha/beta superfamily hydrolase
MLSDDDSPLPGTEVHYLKSAHVGDEFKILIGHTAPPDGQPRPVLFISDTVWTFGTAVEITRLLHLAEDLPALLLVGVGYRASTIMDTWNSRFRDFTPTEDRTNAENAGLDMGGAERFLAFFREELKPWLRDRYEADLEDSTFFGDSLGGLFGTYVLFREPSTFQRYGLGSPSYWWDDGVAFKHEAEYARTHDDLDARVYASVGAYETPEGLVREWEQRPPEARARAEADAALYPPDDMVEQTERMVALLRGRAYPSLVIESEVLAGEYHQTAPPLNLSRALRNLFEAPR